MKKCLKRESNPRSPVCQASMLTIRPWMVGWGGLMRACSTVATCVWSAYGLRPSHFNCLCQEGIQLTRMNGVRDSVLAFCSGGHGLDSRLWWPYSMPTCKDDLCGQTVWPPIAPWWRNIMVVLACWWRARYGGQSGRGKTSSGRTVGGWNNHTPDIQWTIEDFIRKEGRKMDIINSSILIKYRDN